jgi:hypothetical protein
MAVNRNTIRAPQEGQSSGGYTYDGTRWVPNAEYAKKQSAIKLGEKQRDLLKQVNEIALPKLQAEKARDGEYLTQWNNSYLDSKNRLQEIIADSESYSAEVRTLARQKLASLESSYKTGSATAYSALGKKPGDKDTPTIGQLAIYAKSQQPPDTKAILQENVEAMKSVLGEAANLELQYAPQLAQVTGQAQREQMIKNIQAATDTPEISALRSKSTLTPAEQQKLAQYDAQFANIPTAELAARTDTLFNQAIQQGKLEQYQRLMPQYQQQYLEQMPGAEQTLQSLGQLGTQMAQRATERPELTAFEQQVGGPTYGQELGRVAGPTAGQILGQVQGPTYGQELGQVQGPVAGQALAAVQGPTYGQELGSVDRLTTGEYLSEVAWPLAGQYLGGVTGPTYGQELGKVQGPTSGGYLGGVAGPSVDMTLGGMQTFAPGQFTGEIAGPKLQSNLGTIDQNLVAQYMGAIPGVAEGAQRLGEQVNLDLAAGRSLTPEQERLATQAAREAYAARGMALGPQAITSEVLNREELANQRYRERQAAAQQAMGTISALYQPALAQAYARQAGAEQYGLGAQAQAFGQAMSQEDLARVAQAQEYQQRFGLQQLGLGAQAQQYQQALGREQLGLATQEQQFGQAATREQQAAAIQAQQYQQALGREQLGLGAQAQQYQQALGREQLGVTTQAQQFEQAATREQQQAAIQAQRYQQAMGQEQLGLTTQAQQFGQAATREQQQAAIQAQQYQQALNKEQLGLSTQAQQFGQAATREQQQAAIQAQQFGQALARGEAESGRLQAANTLQSNAANIAASTLGTQQQAISPAMSAYFNVPPTQGAYGTSANQAQNQYAQAGLNIANPTNPVITGLNMMPYQNVMSQYSNQANFAASYLQGRASAPSGGGGGLCCFIMLEARYGNGVMDEVVRRYRDEHVTPRNQRGYYKLAEVFVPLMRKSKLFKLAVSKLFADPLVSFAKWYYGQNRHGWVFKPVEGFWMNVFDLLGEDVPFIRENGEVV